jgi:hypothetical protein
VSTPSVAPAVATRTTADSTTSPYQQRVAVALAIAELERSLTRLELRLLPRSTAAGTERRRQHLLAASVHALDALLPA